MIEMSSLLNLPLKLLFNEDIKNQITIKLEEIRFVSELHSFDIAPSFIDFDIPSINYEDVIKEKNISENIFKLSIDLWRDFDYYKQLQFKSQYDDEEYKEKLKSLGYVYEENVWKSSCRPTEEVIQTCVFMYCVFHWLSIEKKGILNCPFCDSVFEGDICEGCYTSLQDIIDYQKNIEREEQLKKQSAIETVFREQENCMRLEPLQDENNELLNMYQNNNNKEIDLDTKNDKGCVFTESVEVLRKEETNNEFITEIIDDSIFLNTNIKINENIKEEIFIEKVNNVRGAEACVGQKSSDKWKCGGCGCLNDYISVNCKVCCALYKDGKWICGKCTMENSCANKNCTACLINNENDIDKIDVVEEYGVEVEKWKCRRCGCLNDHVLSTCEACGELYKDGKWICKTCEMKNNFFNDKCTACQVLKTNVKLEDKKSIFKPVQNKLPIKKNILEPQISMKDVNQQPWNIKINGNHWKCSFTHCGKLNYENNKYCQKCKLKRHSSRVRGVSVRILSDNQEKSVWMCHSCRKINGLTESLCVCGKTRFRKAHCKGCKEFNNGSTQNCVKCQMKMF